jgi:hypothetical protein
MERRHMKSKTLYLIAIMNLSFAVTIGATDLKAQHLAGKVHVIEEESSSWTTNGEVVQGPLMGKSTYTYNEKGKQTEWSEYNSDGSLTSKTTYLYDENGKLTVETEYNPDGSLKSKTICAYDKKGNPTEGTRYNPDGSLNARTIYTYDQKEKLTEQRTEYTSDSSLNAKTIYTYDENGKQTGGGQLSGRRPHYIHC